MPKRPSLNPHVFEETQALLDNLERELSLFREKDSPSLAPEQHHHDTFENDTPCPPPTGPESALMPDRSVDGAAAASTTEKANMAVCTCPKCEGHAFERGHLTPLGEQLTVPVLQCANCGVVVGTLDPTQAIEELQKQIAAIDAGLIRIVKALQGQ